MPRDTSLDPPDPVQARTPAARGQRPKRRYVRFTRWRRRRFFALLGESGNVRMACALSGTGLGCIYRLRRTEPGFVALMEAAKAKADEGLGRNDAPGRGPSTAPRAAQCRVDRASGPSLPSESRGGIEGDDCVVIRHGRGGRLRLMAAGDHWWSSRHDSIFLGHLRVTGNATASAKAAGFTVKSAWNRRDRLPSFARAWDRALEEAEERLNGRLVAEVLTGTLGMDRHGTAQERATAAAERGPFDVWLALWLLKHWEAQRQGKKRRRGAGGAETEG